MNYLTHQLLNAEESDCIKKELEKENQGWEDGKNTAGSHAAEVKNNLQLKRNSDSSIKFSGLITKKGLSLNSFVPFFTPPPVSNNRSFSFDILNLTSDEKSEINFSI